ncbi:hypothetical protein BDE36_2109 [Arcticibacter tournemirensis]|nr:hypothetical protein BDE36_2109 [Arcticibacter tournemirensis]
MLKPFETMTQEIFYSLVFLILLIVGALYIFSPYDLEIDDDDI